MRSLFDVQTRTRLDEAGWFDDPRAEVALRVIWEGPDPAGAVDRLIGFLRANPGIDVLARPELAHRLAHLVGASRELAHQVTRHPEWLVGDPDDILGLARSTLVAVAADDLAGLIDVSEGGRRLSDMADEVVGQVLAEESPPETPPLAVMAFGKWGGRELNYWSDVDLTFVFAGGPSEAAAANKAAAAVMRRLGATSVDGPVLHVDADLRPEGSRGPLARSLDAYRSYYERWAEPWEFQALLKVRPAVGDREVGAGFMEMVGEVLWPETLDPDSIRALRTLKARVEAGADPGDLKRAPGGIRDIEFSVQMLQLVHGRFDPDLRQTSTLDLIDALVDGGYVTAGDATTFAGAYRWLRAAEHRLQLWDLRPTHLLPSSEVDRDRLARAMRYRDSPDRTALSAFEADLVAHRATVRKIHEDLYFRPLLEAFATTPTTGLSREGAERRLEALGFRDIPAAARTFDELTAGLSRRSRLMHQMLPLLLAWLAESPDPDLGLDQLRLLAANLPDHSELITTLHDRPVVGRRLTRLLGSSRLLGSYLDRIPEFAPTLADDATISHLRPKPELEERLRRRVEARPGHAAKVGTIRRFARRQLLRVAARDMLDLAEVDQTVADLSAAADVATSIAATLAGAGPGFAVIAMGRWGGGELSYGSDLDLLYVYDEPHTAVTAMDVVREFRDVLSRPAQDGVAWELDANLRPEGRSGPLVRSLSSYASYYARWAHTWEFQALVKARPVAGDPDLGARFMAATEPLVWRDPFPAAAATEIRQMKARVERDRSPAAGEDRDFHLKLGPGGLIDVEFLTQLLQLGHGGADPALRVPGTMAALGRLAAAGILTEAQAGDLLASYRFCTHVRNRLYLQTGRRIDALPTEHAEEGRLAISLGYHRRADLREAYRRLTRRARRVIDDLFY